MTEQRSISGPLKIVSNHYLVLPVGTTTDRNAITAPTRGMLRYNSTTEKLEFYNAPKNKWGNFVDEDLLYSELAKKVNKAGDSMSGDLNMGAHIKPTADDQYDLGSATLRWHNIYGKTLYIDEIKNPNGGKSIFEGDLKGNADTATVWQTARKLTLSGDSSGDVTFDGSADFTLNVTNSVATRWRDPSKITIESTNGDIDAVENSFDGQNNTDMHFDIAVNKATKWRNPVNISASGNVKLANTTDPWGVDPNIASITVPIQGDDGTINLPFVITSVPDAILRNNYVWKHGDTMDGPLTMDNAAIYSEWDQDLVITSRQNLALTAAYGGGIDMQSDDDIDLLTPAIIRLRSNHVWQVGNGAFQMARGYTSDRPEDMYTDIGMIRLNRDLHSQKTHPITGGYMNGGRIEFYNESKYVDPTKLTPGMDPYNSDLDKATGWTALVSDDDLRDSPIVKELIARMISDFIYTSIGTIDLQMQSSEAATNHFDDPANPTRLTDTTYTINEVQDLTSWPSYITNKTNTLGKIAFSGIDSSSGVNYHRFAGNYTYEDNRDKNADGTLRPVVSLAGGQRATTPELFMMWPTRVKHNPSGDPFDTGTPQRDSNGNLMYEQKSQHVASSFTFDINVGEVVGIPTAKLGNYKYTSVSCLFKVREENFWDYGGGSVRWEYAVDMVPIAPDPAQPALNDGKFRISINLFAFHDYHSANLGARWFSNITKYKNFADGL